jgi:predicted RNA polymerase sigma factor
VERVVRAHPVAHDRAPRLARVARAELLRQAGDAPGAATAYERAIALTANAVERAELERRRAGLAR